MRDSRDFIGKSVRVDTKDEYYVGTLVAIEENGLIVERTEEDSDGNNKTVSFFLFKNALESVKYDPEGDYKNE